MLTKCINPLCSQYFLHLESGRLFRLEQVERAGIRRSEYFWLCRNCAEKMTLRLNEENGIKIVELRETAPRGRGPMDLVLLDRQNGVLLTGINFAGDRVRRHSQTGEGGQIRL